MIVENAWKQSYTYNLDVNAWFDFHSYKNAVNKKTYKNGIRVQFDQIFEFEPNDGLIHCWQWRLFNIDDKM